MGDSIFPRQWGSLRPFFLVALALLSAAASAEDAASPVAAVESGVLRGAADGDAHAFLGVPYAAPPVGDLRYRPPAPAPSWSGERAATAYASPCPQFPAGMVGRAPEYLGQEDCLYLNVWTPADRNPEERLPVMVFLHGGGNFSGSNAQPLDDFLKVTNGGPAYDGARLAARGRVLVVTPNYRLGALGFVAHTVTGSEESGNFGILDQQAALAWVQRNIEAFGGDPARVLLFGQSGGAYDVCIHLTSPSSAGLFSRALMMSGVCYAHPLPLMEDYTRRFLNEMGCASSGDPLECLRRIEDPRKLVLASSAQPRGLGSFSLHPYVDGILLPGSPALRIQTGAHHSVPFGIGSTSAEYAHRFENVTEATYVAVLAQALGLPLNSPLLREVLEVYPRSAYQSARDLVIDAVTDRNLTCSSRAIARALSQSQSEPVYRYHFRQTLSTPLRSGDGPYHASDLLYLFQHMTGEVFEASDDDRLVERHMLEYWTRFAAEGDPNGADRVLWPSFAGGAGEPFLILQPQLETGEDLKREACDFWEQVSQRPSLPDVPGPTAGSTTWTSQLTAAGSWAYDPEILALPDQTLVSWQDEQGRIWLAEADLPANALRDARVVATNGAPLLQTYNGPEFGLDSNGWAIYYTRRSPAGAYETARVQIRDGLPRLDVVPGGELFSPLPTQNPQGTSTRLLALRPATNAWATAVWLDLAAPEQRHEILSVPQRTAADLRWIQGTWSFLTSNHPSHRGALTLVDTASGAVTRIASPSGALDMPYGWKAPEAGGALQALVMVDDKQLQVWRQHDTGWQLLLTLDSPETAAGYPYLGSPEPFTAHGRSFVSMIVSNRREVIPGQTDQHIWIASLDPAAPFATRCDDGEPGPRTRVDPEAVARDGFASVFYYTMEPRSSRMFVCRTALPD